MYSPPEASPRLAPALGLVVLLATMAASAAEPAAVAKPTPVQREDIEHAVAQLRTDPNLGHASTQRQLRWNDTQPPGHKENPVKPTASSLQNFLEFLTSAARGLVWMAGLFIAGCIAIWIWRLVRTRQIATRIATARVATHVEGLDIRPASLPSDIGAAALALLREGKTRAALSLLYRGSLSRAVHRFALSIGESFTEAEALRAVKARLDAGRADYFAALVATWQGAVYGAMEPPHDAVAGLCTSFATTFDAGAR